MAEQLAPSVFPGDETHTDSTAVAAPRACIESTIDEQTRSADSEVGPTGTLQGGQWPRAARKAEMPRLTQADSLRLTQADSPHLAQAADVLRLTQDEAPRPTPSETARPAQPETPRLTLVVTDFDSMFSTVGAGALEAEQWQERALCAQTDPEAFFPEKGGSTREAKRICMGCEVRDECLEYALANDERFGIWGGLSERERRRLKRGII